LPREELCVRLTAAGLKVLSSVSRLTAALVCNDPRSDSLKAQRARAEGTLVVDEQTVLRLLANVQPGSPKDAPGARAASPALPAQRTARRRPGRCWAVASSFWAVRMLRLLRSGPTAAGGAAAVNLSATVTDPFLLDGAEADSRLARAVAAGVRAYRGPVTLGIALPTH
jgi:DNA polymerase-3 subunit epsilon